MAEVYKEFHQTVRADTTDAPIARRRVMVYGHEANAAQKAVYFIAGVIITLLGLRFLLSLLGANRGNPFADFVYVASHPFVAPFFGLFNLREQFGVSRFEFETIVAIIVYSVIAILIANLIAIVTRKEQV